MPLALTGRCYLAGRVGGGDTMSLKLGMPSKGRMQADAIAWFGARGITIRPAEGGRNYTGKIEGIDGVSLTMLCGSDYCGARLLG